MKNQEAVWDILYKERLSWKKETIGLPNIFKGKSVLEFGVGNGKTLKSILKQNPSSVLAVDFSKEALSICRNNIRDQRVEFIYSDIINFNSAKKFDIIVCYYTLNNLSKIEMTKAVRIMQGLLAEKGVILFEDFAKGDFREKQKRKDGLNIHFFTEGEIKFLFKYFKNAELGIKTSRPIRANPELKRKILSATIKK